MNSTFELGRHAARALKPYPDYKDSGVPWLGKVPSHWAVRRIRTIASVISGATPSSNTGSYWEGHIAWVTPQDLGALGSRYMTTSARRITRKGYEACGATMAPAGSVVISTRAPIGHTGILSSTACTNQGCRLLVPNGAIQPEHLYYSLKVARPELESIGQGTTFAELSRNELARFAVPVAPRREQAAIVRFLDHADRRIRRYIRAKQKLIALLEEQKQAIIHQAVTRGLDPNVRLKPSGVEWLGDVPEHWERRAVWQLFEIGRGKVTSHEYIANHSGSFPLYSSQTANDGVMGHIDTFMFDGDFLTWTTDGAHAGTVFRRSGKFNCTNVCGTLFPKTQFDLDFMRMAIASETKRQVRLDINPKLMNNMMARIRVSVPPYDEQVRITKCVQGIAKPSDSVIEQAQLQVGFLREYRTRLIADVVTGKLDVRAAAARLQDEVEELEPLDEADALIDGEDEPTDALATAP